LALLGSARLPFLIYARLPKAHLASHKPLHWLAPCLTLQPPSNGASSKSKPNWHNSAPGAQAISPNSTTSAARRAAAVKDDPPRKHGPYYQLSYTWQRKSHSEFVRLENLAAFRQQLTNYQRLRTLVDEWIALGLNAAQLQRHSDPSGSKPRPKTQIPHKTSL
jgi:hypothetical protein